MSANAREFRPLSELGLPPASREPDKDRSAEIVQLLPHGHPTRLRIMSPDEVAAALEPKAPQSDADE